MRVLMRTSWKLEINTGEDFAGTGFRCQWLVEKATFTQHVNSGSRGIRFPFGSRTAL